jgi:quercetin dioxygenase-like cupin family protein
MTGATVDWRLTDPGRQLDANLVRLNPEHHIGEHVEPDLDVLLVAVEGDGVVHLDSGDQRLVPGAVVWLPRGSRRSVRAGAGGLAYLTSHQRRPGMKITAPPPGTR